jgi:hypothetical protein
LALAHAIADRHFDRGRDSLDSALENFDVCAGYDGECNVIALEKTFVDDSFAGDELHDLLAA